MGARNTRKVPLDGEQKYQVDHLLEELQADQGLVWSSDMSNAVRRDL